MKKRLVNNPLKNSSGFIIADFLFAFVLVISIGIFIFGITFSLATVEVAQYIVWTTARNYSSGNENEAGAQVSARKKFENITAAFPSLTGNGATDPWFELLETNLVIGELSTADPTFSSLINSDDKTNRFRQPWTGASAKIYLKLFAGFQIPFLGKVAADQADFEFPVRAFIIRNPSQEECRNFFYQQRYSEGILKLENGTIVDPTIRAANFPAGGNTLNGLGEDNGC